MCMNVCVCYIYIYIFFSKWRKHFRKPSVLKPEPYLCRCSYGEVVLTGTAHRTLPSLSNHRAGEAAGLQAVWRDARGARWGEGPQRARDPESEGAPEAGHGCSAGETESGQQPGPLRVRGSSDGLTGSREQHTAANSPAFEYPREWPALEGGVLVLVFFFLILDFTVHFSTRVKLHRCLCTAATEWQRS